MTPANQLFIGLSETWLKDHLDAELNIDGYTLYRSDRKRQRRSTKGRDSGGTAFYVRNDIASTCNKIFEFSNGVVEILAIHSKSENLVLCTVYRQPDNSANGYPSKFSQFQDGMLQLKSKILELDNPMPDIIIGGDFNLPHIDWPLCTPKPGSYTEEPKMIELLDHFSQELNLTQHVNEPTHKDGNTLDLLLTNNNDLIITHSILDTLNSISHHSIIEVATTYQPNSPLLSKTHNNPKLSQFDSLNFFSDQVNWDNLNNQLMEHNWNQELRGKSPDKVLSDFYSVCYDIAQKHVPKKRSKPNRPKHNPTQRLRFNLTRRRRRINKLLSRITSPSRRNTLKTELIKIEVNLQKSYKATSAYEEEVAVNAIKRNSKFFYSYAKKFSKVKNKIGPLLDNNVLVTDPKKMADILSKQYSSVFSTPRHDPPNIQTQLPGINDIPLNEMDFEEMIDELDQTSAAGPDGFPAIFLKNCKKSLSKPLLIIWRKCLDSGITPETLKKSCIIPIHKGGNRASPERYRPVALTSHLIKIFEKILRKHLTKYIDDNSLFNPNQHGFRSGRSCLSQLLSHYDEILSILETGKNADVVYLDFSKAFDKVDHNLVLSKIQNLGIGGKILTWIQSFLTNRKQTIIVDGVPSDPSPVISGVPQGSVLGPLIFLILIGDIDEKLKHSSARSFADDTRVIKGIENVDDSMKLQEDLDEIYDWSNENSMEFNDVKFELLRYGPNRNLKQQTSYKTSSNTIIEEHQFVRDLGVMMSNDCKFQIHMNTSILNARKLASWILRTFKTRSPTVLGGCMVKQLFFRISFWTTFSVNLTYFKTFCEKISSKYKKLAICPSLL